MKPRRGKQYGSTKESHSIFQTAAFRLGYLYRDIKAQLNALGAETGGAITPPDAAHWVGTLLLAETRGELLDGTQHLPQMRGATDQGNEIAPGTTTIHVRSHDDKPLKRRLSKSARNRIAQAQRLRWAKTKRKSKVAIGAKSYWDKMSPEERSAEMQRRVKVRNANKKKAA